MGASIRGWESGRQSIVIRSDEVYPREEVTEAVKIPRERVGVGEEEVGESDGLSALEVSKPRGKVVDPLLGSDGEDANDLLQPLDVLVDLLHEPESHVGRDLVVPAPSRVQLASNVTADDLRQATLVRSVDVLVVGLDLERPALPFGLDSVEAGADSVELGGSEDRRRGAREGERVGLGSRDIHSVETLVVRKTLVELPHPATQLVSVHLVEAYQSSYSQRVGLALETSSPELLGHCFSHFLR